MANDGLSCNRWVQGMAVIAVVQKIARTATAGLWLALVVALAVGTQALAAAIYLLAAAGVAGLSGFSVGQVLGWWARSTATVLQTVKVSLTWGFVDRLGAVAFMLGQSGAWPVRTALGFASGFVVGFVMPRAMENMRDDERHQLFAFYVPQGTLIFLAFLLQSMVFLTVPMPTQSAWVAAAIWTHCGLFALFACHLAGRNVSASPTPSCPC